MGLIKLRDSDIALARRTSLRDPALDRPWFGDAKGLLSRWHAEAKALRLRITYKPSRLGLRWSKFSTTYYREIRLGYGYKSARAEWQATTFGHELMHARQWRAFGRRVFRTRYLFWARWRWAIEVQAYAESVRILVALGATKETLDRYIASRPDALWNGYGLRGLRKRDVYAYTLLVLNEARARAEARAGR